MTWQTYLDDNQERFVEELIRFVKIPSVSARTEHASDVAQAADWVVQKLARIGMNNAQAYKTAGHPVVCADWLLAGADKPTVLIYGHFDVQPAEPLAPWTTPPFEPALRDGKLYGRGASDDKGGMMTPILAIEALLATTGRLPVNVKVFFEGEEEIGSPSIPEWVAAHRDILASDMIFSADGLQWSPDQPMLVTGLKGMMSCEVILRGPTSDQHSGLHGGGIANPAMGLAQLLATMKSTDGLITIDGFYDDVEDLSDEVRAEIARVPYDEASYLAETGAPAVTGEPGYTTRERLWARPTLDINGLTSGYQGDGTMTVLPSEARAKITCRLVAGQMPERVHKQIEAHVMAHVPAGLRAEVRELPGRGEPFEVPKGHNATGVAASVLEKVYGTSPYVTRLGGSIPIMTALVAELGLHPVMFGFSHGDENLHAADEFFRLDSFRKGQEAYVRLLQALV